MANLEKEHLCKLVDKKYTKKKFKDYAALVASPDYICEKCGRAAASKKNLCKPVKIKS